MRNIFWGALTLAALLALPGPARSQQTRPAPDAPAVRTDLASAEPFVPRARLGMTLRELVKARPGLRKFVVLPRAGEDLRVDPNLREGMVGETLSSSRDWEGVVYRIEGGRVASIILGGRQRGQTYPPRRDAFVTDLMKRYGRPDSYAVIGEEKRLPSMLWRAGGESVAALFSDWTPAGRRPAVFTLLIATNRTAMLGPTAWAKITPEQKERLVAPLRAAAENALRQKSARRG
jgi:hypothetical protein